MNTQNKLARALVIAAYIALMIISTWATVESASRALPGWPIAFIWVFSIIFFFIASYGVQQIMLSMDKSVRVSRRFVKLLKGVGCMSFWIILILPTNTHTFFYKSVIADYTVQELKYTEGQLNEMLKKGVAGKIIEQEKLVFTKEVDQLFGKYAAEVNNPGEIGNGERAEKILVSLQEKLGDIQRLTLRSQSLPDRKNFLERMWEEVKLLREAKLREFEAKLENINRGIDKDEVTRLLLDIRAIENRIQAHKEGRLYGKEAEEAAKEPSAATRAKLIAAFQLIKKYSEDVQAYYPNTPNLLKYETPVIVELDDVIEVWKNAFAGLYKKRGFAFWVIVSVLIDMAGFVTYTFAKQQQD